MSADVVSRLSSWALRWLLLAALWLALADSRGLPELIAAASAAAVGATFAGVILRPGRPRTASGLIGLGRLGPRVVLRPLARLAIDSALLSAALWNRVVRRDRVAGSFRAAEHTPRAGTRTAAARAVTEIWGSLMPNRYVVGVDDESSIILVHELIRTEEPLDPLARR